MTASKKNSSKTTTRTKKSENIQNVEISYPPAERIDEDGNVYTTGLTTIEKKRYREIIRHDMEFKKATDAFDKFTWEANKAWNEIRKNSYE